MQLLYPLRRASRSTLASPWLVSQPCAQHIVSLPQSALAPRRASATWIQQIYRSQKMMVTAMTNSPVGYLGLPLILLLIGIRNQALADGQSTLLPQAPLHLYTETQQASLVLSMPASSPYSSFTHLFRRLGRTDLKPQTEEAHPSLGKPLLVVLPVPSARETPSTTITTFANTDLPQSPMSSNTSTAST